MSEIDRRALVSRHDVEVTGVDPTSPLSVGNGEFCVTVDVTGLQSLPHTYPVQEPSGGPPGTLLGTLSNPHRIDLARIGFAVAPAGGPSQTPRPDDEVRSLGPGDLAQAQQRLDLWGGVLDSRFVLAGRPVRVRTVCHPTQDVLGVRIRSSALAEGLVIRIAFPDGSAPRAGAADRSRPQTHRTDVLEVSGGWVARRELDGTRYQVRIAAWPGTRLRRTGPHELVLSTDRADLGLSIAFQPGHDAVDGAPPGAAEVETASRRHWAAFWSGGGAVELAGSSDPRAGELERRVVLSQYLTAINCAGSLPPAETGLTGSSWHGRFQLETHWWHGAHFATWGRSELLERSLAWYLDALPVARAIAREQGHDGARWPQRIGAGSPESQGGPFLIWQQPHPIHLAELIRRAQAAAHAGGTGADPARVVKEYAPVVLGTADFMASLAERHGLRNPTFELAYWRWGLQIATQWRRYLGMDLDPHWQAVADGLIPAPQSDGVHAAVRITPGEPWTVREGHPWRLYALGLVPPTGFVDPDAVRRTLGDVLREWDWDSTWGCDFPATAMTAARLGAPATAVDVLLMPVAKNHYVVGGHNRQSASLPVYLPGNGGLLAAVALMAAGWDGTPTGPAPGFPAEGWTVRHEGLVPSP